jgi:hypothetical protein
MQLYIENNSPLECLDHDHLEAFLKSKKVSYRPHMGIVENFYNLAASDYINSTISYNEDGEELLGTTNDESSPQDQIEALRLKSLVACYEANKDILNKFNVMESAFILAKIFTTIEANPKGSQDSYNLGSFDNNMSFQELMDLKIEEIIYYNQLGNSLAFQGKGKSLIRDTVGSICKYSHMEYYSELVSVDILAHFMPGFDEKFAEKNLPVRTKYRLEQKSENLIILVDRSASMNNDIDKTRAILRKKFKKIRPEDKIFFSFFEARLDGFRKIDPAYTDLFLKEPIKANGGGTNVNECIKEVIFSIQNGQIGDFTLSKKVHFEILIINDGQDSIDQSYHPPIKVHTISVEKENQALKTLCLRSGGSYMVI